MKMMLLWISGLLAITAILMTMANVSPHGQAPGSLGTMQVYWFTALFAIAWVWLLTTLIFCLVSCVRYGDIPRKPRKPRR
jgi:hypothetical protein